MFGLFKKKLKFNYDCPLCTIPYRLTMFPDQEKFDNDGQARVLSTNCKFCKVQYSVYASKINENKYEINPVDDKWDDYEENYLEKCSEIEEKIKSINLKLNHKNLRGPRQSLDSLRKQKIKLSERLGKLNSSYESKLDKYSDRQCKWEMKVEREMDRASYVRE